MFSANSARSAVIVITALLLPDRHPRELADAAFGQPQDFTPEALGDVHVADRPTAARYRPRQHFLRLRIETHEDVVVIVSRLAIPDGAVRGDRHRIRTGVGSARRLELFNLPGPWIEVTEIAACIIGV